MLRKKILLIITKSNWGGAQRYVYDIASELAKDESFDVCVALGGNGELSKRLESQNITVIEIPNLERDISILRDIKAFFWMVRLLEKQKPDVVHLNSSKAGGLGALAGRITGIKHIIFTSHGWAFDQERPQYQKTLIRLGSMLIVFLAHKTICVSKSTLAALNAPRFIERRCTVIHNGISPIVFKPRGEFFEERSMEKKEEVSIISIGELHKSKGFDLAMNYLSELRELSWEWHILGEGEEWHRLEKQIISLGLEQRVVLHGHTPLASTYLKSFDVFFLPSRTESLGYVAMEAIQTDLPILASNAGGIPEVLRKDPGTTFVNIRSKETKDIIEKFLKNIPISVFDAARADLRKEFSLEHMMRLTKAVYLF